jgi:hypothetical protein
VLQSGRSKTRDLRGTQRRLNEPGDDAPDIDCCRRDDVLQMRFRKPKIACLPQIADAHGLRDGPFDASANGIGFLKCFGTLPLSRQLQGEREALRAKGQATRSPVRTLLTARTTLTRRSSKLGVDHLLSRAILGECPGIAVLTSGTRDPAVLPIDLKAREIEGICGFGAALCSPGERDQTRQPRAWSGSSRWHRHL